jgi:hypothetical protein
MMTVSCAERRQTAPTEKIDHWTAAIGFLTLAVILIIEGLALYHLFHGPMAFRPPEMAWPETIMRLLFGDAR